MSDPLLSRLADLAGIEPRYRDERGRMRTTSETSKRGVLKALGFSVDSSAQLEASLREAEAARWHEAVPPVVVAWAGSAPRLPLTLPSASSEGWLAWELVPENGASEHGRVPLAQLPLVAASAIEGGRFERRTLTLSVAPEEGYHRLVIEAGGGRHEIALIVTGGRCFLPAGMARGPGAWGWAVQLYALRAAADWGIGDYSRLAEFAQAAAAHGAAAVGLNPLHVLSLSHPERASPYSPSSRLLFTVIYIDVEACADLASSPEARARIESAAFQERLAKLRSHGLVHYRDVAAAKLEILQLLFAAFRADAVRRDEFQRYRDASGQALRRWAVFEALSRHFSSSARWWREWPAPYRDPNSQDVAAFVADHAEDVEFFEYLQWLAETQLASAARACRDHRLPIGLYSDLALGVDHDSADVWGQGDLYAAHASIGAPPDVMNLRGQNWGIAPMNPLVLRRRGYAPFVAVLRSAMKYGGALRIDHVMSLKRLYWIPEGAEPIDGAYVRQPFEDLVGVLALESTRARCMVIGEDLGTVPSGFRPRMQRARVLSYKPLFFQIDKEGEFLPSAKYARMSAAVVGTHDMATLPGFWAGRDLDVRRSLDLADTRFDAAEERAARRTEKHRLLAMLMREGLLDAAHADPDAPLDDALVRAIHAFLARTPARLLMVRPEDALAIAEQHNLPGTVDQHANWRLRLPMDVSGFAADERLSALARLLSGYRPSRAALRRRKGAA